MGRSGVVVSAMRSVQALRYVAFQRKSLVNVRPTERTDLPWRSQQSKLLQLLGKSASLGPDDRVGFVALRRPDALPELPMEFVHA